MKKLILLSSVFFLFWNLENFYDYVDSGTGESDTEFSPSGMRKWTAGRFYSKVSAISKALLYISEIQGRIPDVFAVSEVENRFVLERLAGSQLLRKCGYAVVHYESHDRRGIDCALLYRKDSLQLLQSFICPVLDPDGDTLQTRDLLAAVFRLRSGQAEDTVSLIVNHHPSKMGGKAAENRRERAMETMLNLSSSLPGHIVSLGDFNEAPSIEGEQHTGGWLEDLSVQPASEGKGSIRFNGEWELIDRIFVSPELSASVMEVFSCGILSTPDKAHGGVKPRRTYNGPAYAGGISDHYPIGIFVEF